MHLFKNMKTLFSDPRFYADIALCGIVLLVVVAVSGTSIPQLGREAWAAVTTITGDGTQNALAQFTGTNTIRDASVRYYSANASNTNLISTDMGVHFACFLVNVEFRASSGGGSDENACWISGLPGNPWTLYANSRGTQITGCSALCIN